MESMMETKVDAVPKLRAKVLRLNGRKRTRLKGEKSKCEAKPIVNIKGMNVILHRLCPVPINR
jgi:hypothetical protein